MIRSGSINHIVDDDRHPPAHPVPIRETMLERDLRMTHGQIVRIL